MIRTLLRPQGCDEPCEVRLEQGADRRSGAYLLHVGDQSHEIEVNETGAGSGFFRIRGHVHAFCMARRGDRVDVWLDGRIHSFELVDRSAQRSGAASAQGNLAGDTVIAPMPGTILKIHVAAGDDISTHAPLIVMESMKMEMTLAAPRDGRVRAVSCEAGQLVEMGKLLLTLEPREHA